MSGLLERIARRRRASASSRLGPPPDSADRYVKGMPPNGSGAPLGRSLNGAVREHAPAPAVDGEIAEAAPVAEDLETAVADDVPVPASHEAAPDLEQATSELWAADEDQWIEPERPHETDAEPESDQVESELEPEPEPPPLGLVERARIRRRARYLRRLKEVQLRDIGGFLLELHRFGRERPDLVSGKIASAAGTDRELRALEQALYGSASLRELREAGIGGACGECGAVHGSDDHFCASCGAHLNAHPDDEPEPGELDDTHV
jgi:hypothetical protein